MQQCSLVLDSERFLPQKTGSFHLELLHCRKQRFGESRPIHSILEPNFSTSRPEISSNDGEHGRAPPFPDRSPLSSISISVSRFKFSPSQSRRMLIKKDPRYFFQGTLCRFTFPPNLNRPSSCIPNQLIKGRVSPCPISRWKPAGFSRFSPPSSHAFFKQNSVSPMSSRKTSARRTESEQPERERMARLPSIEAGSQQQQRRQRD